MRLCPDDFKPDLTCSSALCWAAGRFVWPVDRTPPFQSLCQANRHLLDTRSPAVFPRCADYSFKAAGDWNLNTTQKRFSFSFWKSEHSCSLVWVYVRWRLVFPSTVEPDRLLRLVSPSAPASPLISVRVLCITTYLWPTTVSVAHDRSVPSSSSNIGSDPCSRCCLSAGSIHTRGIEQICANLLELSSTDSDAWPLTCKIYFHSSRFTYEHGLKPVEPLQTSDFDGAGLSTCTERLDRISAEQHSHGWREKKYKMTMVSV